MKRLVIILLGVSVAAVLIGGPAATAARTANSGIALSDPAGDVKIYKRKKGLSTARRKSIDVRKVVISDRAKTTRIAVTVKRLIRTKAFRQRLYLDVNTSRRNTYASYVFYAQDPSDSLVYYQFGGGKHAYRMCNRVKPKVTWGAMGKIVAIIPHRCVPGIAADIHLQTTTDPIPQEMWSWSQDVVKFRHRLRG